MIKEQELLEDALAKKVITAEQFEQMSAMVEPTINRNPDERFRIVSGFSEVFISIGLTILFGAVHGSLQLTFSNHAAGTVLAAGFAWVTASYFVERKRHLLPSIVACIYSALYVGKALWLVPNFTFRQFDNHAIDLWLLVLPIAGALATLLAAAWRYRIPFLMLPIGVLFALLVVVTTNWGSQHSYYILTLATCGLIMLGVALQFDLKDPQRIRRASDFAFWCYVIGSPLTIHPLFITFLLGSDYKHTTGSGILIAVGLILMSAIISLFALIINRRALVLSTLIYVGLSIGYLAHSVGGTQIAPLIAMLIIGLYVVSLGTAWRNVRKKLMQRLTPRPWFSKLPPY